jgi:basic membrane lipoprotein Med (substrate-binding protein (PBP1-ABC) superfamily)
MYSGMRKIDPSVELLVWDVNGFDNKTNQEAATNDLIDKGCDIIATVRETPWTHFCNQFSDSLAFSRYLER